MDKKALTSWLASLGKDREWLAEKIGSAKGTVDQWFSKGFPAWAVKSIERLMNPADADTAGLEVTFTARQFERIEEARHLLGITTRKEFYETAIAQLTDEILAKEQQSNSTENPPVHRPLPPATTRYTPGTEGLTSPQRHSLNETPPQDANARAQAAIAEARRQQAGRAQSSGKP